MPLLQADFQSLKQRIPIDWVLARYGVKLRPTGPHTLYGACPLPTHISRLSRESFSVNLSLRVWSCHSASCMAARDGRIGGHAIDLVAIMERCSLRQAGLRLQDWFGGRASDPPAVRDPARRCSRGFQSSVEFYLARDRHPPSLSGTARHLPSHGTLVWNRDVSRQRFPCRPLCDPHSRREQPPGRLCRTRGPRGVAQIPFPRRFPEISRAVQPRSGAGTPVRAT